MNRRKVHRAAECGFTVVKWGVAFVVLPLTVVVITLLAVIILGGMQAGLNGAMVGGAAGAILPMALKQVINAGTQRADKKGLRPGTALTDLRWPAPLPEKERTGHELVPSGSGANGYELTT